MLFVTSILVQTFCKSYETNAENIRRCSINLVIIILWAKRAAGARIAGDRTRITGDAAQAPAAALAKRLFQSAVLQVIFCQSSDYP